MRFALSLVAAAVGGVTGLFLGGTVFFVLAGLLGMSDFEGERAVMTVILGAFPAGALGLGAGGVLGFLLVRRLSDEIVRRLLAGVVVCAVLAVVAWVGLTVLGSIAYSARNVIFDADYPLRSITYEVRRTSGVAVGDGYANLIATRTSTCTTTRPGPPGVLTGSCTLYDTWPWRKLVVRLEGRTSTAEFDVDLPGRPPPGCGSWLAPVRSWGDGADLRVRLCGPP